MLSLVCWWCKRLVLALGLGGVCPAADQHGCRCRQWITAVGLLPYFAVSLSILRSDSLPHLAVMTELRAEPWLGRRHHAAMASAANACSHS